MSDLFKSEFFTDEATVYNLKDSMWLGKPSKSNEWWFGVQNTDATDDERNKAALYIANAINQHEKLVFSLDDRDCYIADADMKNAELIARNAELEALIKEADEYLNTNSMTSIGSGSILHNKFKQALKENS